MSTDSTFRMTVQEIFAIRGRGTVVAGQIASGTVAVGDEILIIKDQRISKKTVVSGLEVYRKVVLQAQKGDNVGVLLREISQEDIQSGDVLAGSETDYTWQP